MSFLSPNPTQPKQSKAKQSNKHLLPAVLHTTINTRLGSKSTRYEPQVLAWAGTSHMMSGNVHMLVHTWTLNTHANVMHTLHIPVLFNLLQEVCKRYTVTLKLH